MPARRCNLISDGDIAGVIWTTDPAQTNVDIYLGSGGAPEGVLAAAALTVHRRADAGPAVAGQRCRAGRGRDGWAPMSTRSTRSKKWRTAMSSSRPRGVTDGSLLQGVHFRGDFAETETVVMRSVTGTVRRVKTTYRNIGTKLAML